ncbi:MAG: GntR family transcriptional regulator [Prolixibacteraceae bacterium]|nr:GntR family transcriptional regulator [Prolixibacteraceae bacterium]MBN2773080.1 GntR family transcriptional regulator [Prolixibacteraceae bacterium]
MNRYQRIDHDSSKPKYRQVIEMIISDIESGIFKKGQRIPSINETSEELLLSRDTVEKAYVALKKSGVLSSVRGKGYYINQTNVYKKLKVALILNKLSNYKRNIYYALKNGLGSKASLDVYIYNYDLQEFEEIVNNIYLSYDYFIILPHFKNENEDIGRVIQKIQENKVLIVDRFHDSLKKYPVVYQEYEKDIKAALTCGIDLLKKYSQLNLIFPTGKFYPKYIERGFRIFCQVNNFKFSVLDYPDREKIRINEAYVIVSDDDLYEFIRIIRQQGWKTGNDIGVVAYNENPVKEILEDGITTISTNHEEIGRLAAEMILTKDFKKVKSPFEFIRRNSL